MPEVEPVRPIQVGVAAEHLAVHVLDLALEALWEARGLAEPVVGVVGSLLWVRQGWWGLERSRWEDVLVDDLAADPGLDVLDVGGGWKVDRVAVRVHPGVRGAIES